MQILVVESSTNFSESAEVWVLGKGRWIVGVAPPDPGGFSVSAKYVKKWYEGPARTVDLELFT